GGPGRGARADRGGRSGDGCQPDRDGDARDDGVEESLAWRRCQQGRPACALPRAAGPLTSSHRHEFVDTTCLYAASLRRRGRATGHPEPSRRWTAAPGAADGRPYLFRLTGPPEAEPQKRVG